MSTLMILLVVHAILAVLSWGIMNGHTHDDSIFQGMHVGVFILCFIVPYIMFAVSLIHWWFYGFKFRLQP